MPPTTADLPPTLSPFRRGAVIDWKATAIAEHLGRVASSEQAVHLRTFRATLTQQVTDLEANLAAVLASNKRMADTQRAVRAHWSAFLLPHSLR